MNLTTTGISTKPRVKTRANIAKNLSNARIPNHYSPSLSALDVSMVRAVPPGGNWKNIPTSIPSQRLAKIRESYLAGQGSRSTYYGRLHPEQPSYTINTYFGRPGNGCHVHYDFEGGQHRVLSHREAARLQSFPDCFVFEGTKGSVATQIGNAVPPILAFQIANQVPYKGMFIDLFSGAGGLSLGFKLAGWTPIMANDIDKSFLLTYKRNIHENILAGDIREPKIIEAIVHSAKAARKENPGVPLFVIGGPPCQGFSTAGNKRSMEDQRNWLFREYKQALVEISPDGFVFENVTGLLSMQGGKVFEMIKSELTECAKSLSFWKLNAEEYGVPQRRTRVILFGESIVGQQIAKPEPITKLRKTDDIAVNNLPYAITVKEALSDLPALIPGEDGSDKEYRIEPANIYQRLMRSEIDPMTYLLMLKNIQHP